MQLNTLAISFYFPPFSRVGGRRWAKHLKYFKKLGERFYVLAGQYEGTSPWDIDTKTYNDTITRVPIIIKYPYYKKKLPSTLPQKIYWKLSLSYWNLQEKLNKGNLWDDSNGSEKRFLDAAIKLINEKQINHVLLSVGPFHYSRILIKLRKRFPEIKITMDYRDYWEDDFASLTERQQRYERSLQNSVLQSVDLVLTPNQEITSHFIDVLKFKNTYTLPHCFDPVDISVVKPENKHKKNSTLQFLYGGALYKKMDNYLDLFCRFIHLLEKQSIETNTNIYTSQPGYQGLFNASGIHYKMTKYLSIPEYFEQIEHADFVLFFRPDWSPNAFSSKFYELLAFRKPILYFGPDSDVSRFLTENRLGFHFNEENFTKQFSYFLENLGNPVIPDKNYNLEQHTFEYQTKKLVNFLNEQYTKN